MTTETADSIHAAIRRSNTELSARGIADVMGIDPTSENLRAIDDACLGSARFGCRDLRESIGVRFFYVNGY